MTNRPWIWVIVLSLVSLLLAVLRRYGLDTASTILSFIGGIGVIIGLIYALRRGYLNFRPWVIHFENRLEEKPLKSDKLRLYPGLNKVFVQVLAKVPVDYSLATILIGLKPRRRSLLALLSYASLYKNGFFNNYPKTKLPKAWLGGSLRNPPLGFFVQLVNVCDKSPLREKLNTNFIAQPSTETGITWFLAYQPPYNLPAGSPIWLYLDIEVGAVPSPTRDFDERREVLGIEFKSGVAGQRRPIFREIKLLSTPQSKDSKRDEL